MELTGVLATFCANLDYESLPPEVVEKAKICILDAVGVALEGAREEAADLTVAYCSRSSGDSTIWANGVKVNYTDAILANTACVQSILHDDVLMSTFAHPAGPVISTVLALGEQTKASGRDTLLATAVGYETMGCIGGGERFAGAAIARGFRGTPLFGVFASAGAAAKIKHLSPEAFQDALGIAASMAGGLLEPMDAGSMEWRFVAGLAARNGVVAAEIAEMGMRAAPRALEGPFGFYNCFCGTTEVPQSFLEEIGTKYQIMDNWHKPFPTGSESTWVAAMKQLQGIARRNDLELASVTTIIVRVMGRMLRYPGLQYSGMCNTISDAIMSKPFAVASILKNKTLNFDIYKEQLQDPVIVDLSKKVYVEPLPGELWDKFVAEVEVRMEDGTVYRGDLEDARPIQFFRDRALAKESFLEITEGILVPSRAEEVVDCIFSLEEVKSVGELTDHLWPSQ